MLTVPKYSSSFSTDLYGLFVAVVHRLRVTSTCVEGLRMLKYLAYEESYTGTDKDVSHLVEIEIRPVDSKFFYQLLNNLVG